MWLSQWLMSSVIKKQIFKHLIRLYCNIFNTLTIEWLYDRDVTSSRNFNLSNFNIQFIESHRNFNFHNIIQYLYYLTILIEISIPYYHTNHTIPYLYYICIIKKITRIEICHSTFLFNLCFIDHLVIKQKWTHCANRNEDAENKLASTQKTV